MGEKIMRKNIIFIVLLLICIFNTSCTHNRLTNKGTEYKQLIDSLQNAYTLTICYKSYRVKEGCTVCDYVNLERWNKSIEDYRNDSIALDKAIIDFYSKDQNFIKYLIDYKKVKSRFSNFTGFSNNNLLFVKDARIFLKIGQFYRKPKNCCLDLILNYYLSTNPKKIKLLLNIDYIIDNKIQTKYLYKKLDKIFEKYGYADKENIRKAILEDFGSCIIMEGM